MSGAFESYKQGGGNKGVKSDISCACHWTVNQASTQQIGTMWGKSYVVTPGGIMVPPESPITAPEHLAGQEIAVGYHSGSHFTTIQALEPFLPRDQIKLKFVGSIWARVDVGVDRDVPATSVWGLTFQVLEQLGFRKVVDTSFMIAFMFPRHVDPADVEKYMNGLEARADGPRRRAGEVQALLRSTKFRSGTRTRSTCAAFRRRAHRVPAVHRSDLRQDPGLARRARHFRVRGRAAGRLLRQFGRRLMAGCISRALLLAALAIVLGFGAADAQAYPSRPITVVVPFAAGGRPTCSRRIVAERMAPRSASRS